LLKAAEEAVESIIAEYLPEEYRPDSRSMLQICFMAAFASLITTGFPLEHSRGILKRLLRIPGQLRSPIRLWIRR
jgi:hypothetical protein